MENLGNHKKNMENLLKSIKNHFELEDNKVSLSKVNSYLELPEYNNVIILTYDNFNDKLFKYLKKESFLESNKLYNITVPQNTKEGIKHLDVLDDINKNSKYKAYGIYNDGLAAYKTVEEAYNMIRNLSEGSDKKLIYANFNGMYENTKEGILKIEDDIHNLYRNIDRSLIIVTGESETVDLKVPLCIIKRYKDAKKVRFAKEKDYLQILEILKKSCKEKMNKREDLFIQCEFFTRNEFINYVEHGKTNSCFVYELDEQIVGFVLFKYVHVNARQYLNSRGFLSVDYICVDENFRRRGIGTELIKEVIEYSKKVKVKRIEFEVWYTDEDVKKFVESLNMNIMSRRYELEI